MLSSITLIHSSISFVNYHGLKTTFWYIYSKNSARARIHTHTHTHTRARARAN